MECNIENGKIIFCENGNTYSFEAHGELPRPSIFPTLSVGGKHLSSRSDEVKVEKHTAIQDVAAGNGVAAWYVQEFLPDGEDYKLSKNAYIYLGDFAAGKETQIYKGECYGDLCFYEDDLYFNMGNKVAVYHLKTGETEVLFKHSGIKKNNIHLHVTPKRIFYWHWTHSSGNLMWYDRETGETVNPHFDGGISYYLDDETILYSSIEHAWLYDASKMKKKRFFSQKEENKIFQQVAEFFGIPEIHHEKYYSYRSKVKLDDYKNDRAYFDCHIYFDCEGNFEKRETTAHELGLPTSMHTGISCDRNGKDIRIEADASDIEIREDPYRECFHLDFPDVSYWAVREQEK